MAKRKIIPEKDVEIKTITKTILDEAKKLAQSEMDCLTELVLQEAKIVARYARKRPRALLHCLSAITLLVTESN